MQPAGTHPSGTALRLEEWRGAVAQHLFSQLQEPTQRRYSRALSVFDDWCNFHSIDWHVTGHEDRDIVLAYFCVEALEGEDDNIPVPQLNDLVAALQRKQPHFRYRHAWRVLEAWRRQHPPEQASPLPLSAVWAGATIAFLLNQLWNGHVGVFLWHAAHIRRLES